MIEPKRYQFVLIILYNIKNYKIKSYRRYQADHIGIVPDTLF
jgi:hypothetical protein